uniref:Uncharacterized protein n=1 Tax=Anguilla anguilla TaxID=7936 RepID=A0A0E9RCV0_ANGAN
MLDLTELYLYTNCPCLKVETM